MNPTWIEGLGNPTWTISFLYWIYFIKFKREWVTETKRKTEMSGHVNERFVVNPLIIGGLKGVE